MTIDKLLMELGERGIRLKRNGDELVISGKQEMLDASLVTELQRHKSTLLGLIGSGGDAWWVPPAAAASDIKLCDLTAQEMEHIASSVPGGAENIQDVYPLAPLQEGIFFHHLMGGDGDPYLVPLLLSFDSRARMDAYLNALQTVIERHDILRTAMVWEGLREPVQVVWRKAILPVEAIELDPAAGELSEQLYERFNPRRIRMDLRHAPLLRAAVVQYKETGRWAMVLLMHHLIGDNISMELMQEEIQAHLLGQTAHLPQPIPFRNLVAQARIGISQGEHEAFFREMLEDVMEPTAPFGLLDAYGDGNEIEEATIELDKSLARQIREQARKMGVSAGTLCHVAWAAVLARTSAQNDVVFGTVLVGRFQSNDGSNRGMGLFVNTLPIRVRLGEETVEACVRRTHSLLADLLYHEHASLTLAQRCSAVAAPSPLFSALFNYRSSEGTSAASSAEAKRAWEGIQMRSREARTNYPITLLVTDMGEGFRLKTHVAPSVGAARVCGYMRMALQSLVEALTSARGTAVGKLKILPEEERRQVLYGWNRTGVEYRAGASVVELFEEQARRRPEAVAVECGEESLSYGELNEWANQVGHYLRGLGVKAEDRVAVCLERGVEIVVAELGVLKAGGAYVPLDPGYPEERKAVLLSDSGAQIVLTSREIGVLEMLGVTRVDMEEIGREEKSRENVGVKVESTGLAYVMYTSGSTGQPNGVMVTHGAINRLVINGGYAEFEEGEGVGFGANPSFDASTMEVWGALLNGGRLVVIKPEVLLDSERLGAELKRQEVRVLWLTVGLYNQYAEEMREAFAGLKYLIVGGDALDAGVIRRVKAGRSPEHLVNGYGPTETTTFAVTHEIEEVGEKAVNIPIGRPIGNTRVYIVDKEMEAVPVGVAGEICIGGVGVGRGYANWREQTAERFVPEVYGEEGGGRMYRTGDLGRWNKEGVIEFLGRMDQQVKVRGYRIELGEIETRLKEYEGIREAVVVARKEEGGEKQLVAYYTMEEGESGGGNGSREGGEEGGIGAEELRMYLVGRLPEYMVPGAYVRMEKMPLTKNGKVDRKRLPAPEGDAYAVRAYEAPEGEVETAVAAVWAEVLKVERVGRQDNFFQLGGHSLLAVRVIARLRQGLGVEVDLKDLFARPVLRDFVRGMEGAKRGRLPEIERVERGERIPLSFAQERLWFLAQMEGVSAAYHVSFGLRLQGELNAAALRWALDRIVERHEALRTTLVAEGGEIVQKITLPEQSGFYLQELDLRQHKDAPGEMERVVVEEAGAPFDLEAGPLIRGQLLKIGEKENLLLITMHHIISDGWSVGVLFKELSVLYKTYLSGGTNPLPELALQYADYAVWQRRWMDGEVLRQQAEYWQENLSGAPEVLELPADHVRPKQQDYTGALVEVVLDEKLTTGLRELSSRQGTTLYMTLLAGWAVLLGRLSGQQDVVIGTPVANRGRVEIENLIGFFVNTLVLRVDVSGRPTVGEMLERVRRQAIAAQQHQDIPFEQVVEILQPARSLAHSPLFQVMFAWHEEPEGMPELPGLEIEWMQSSPHVVSKFDLTLSLQEAGGRILGGLEYARALFERKTIERYVGYYRRLLAGMVEAGKKQAVNSLGMLGEAERQQVVYEWNATETKLPSMLCVHELFEKQAEKTPDAVAVEYKDATLSYAALNRRANGLAHYLRGLGVKAEDRVAICMERGLEMVAGVLGIWKAGAAYVPLDPGYPADRLEYMLQDAAPTAVLTTELLRWRLPEKIRAVVVNAVEVQSEIERLSADHAVTGQLQKCAAYGIYTSGSSGRPKGVVIEHHALSNFVLGLSQSIGFGPRDTHIAVTTLGFDISILELFMPLCYGARVVVASQEETMDREKLSELIRNRQANSMQATPSHWGMIVRDNHASLRNLRMLSGGEGLRRELAEELRASAKSLYNMYGPTEATIWASMHEVGSGGEGGETGGIVTIGRPLANYRMYVLDENLEPVPQGVVGELYIAGDGLARGYLNQAGLNGERFICEPFTGEGGRMYWTGDLARWSGDGRLEFVGRADQQVKVRGYRIELGEIEVRLEECAWVKEAVAVVRYEAAGEKRLVAYYTVKGTKDEKRKGEEGERLEAEELRAHLAAKLPEYMVPGAYVRLDRLPLTGNGKLDRKSLPAPEGDAYARGRYEAPEGETETAVAGIWAEVLKVERVGRHDNFFAVGGHSLLAIRVIARLQQALGVELKIGDLFARPVLASLSERIVDMQLEKFDLPDLADLLKELKKN